MMGMGKRTRNIFLLWIATSVALVMYYEHFKDSVPHRQFYPSMVRVSKNAQAMILATVHWFSFAYLFTKFLIKIFLGELLGVGGLKTVLVFIGVQFSFLIKPKMGQPPFLHEPSNSKTSKEISGSQSPISP